LQRPTRKCWEKTGRLFFSGGGQQFRPSGEAVPGGSCLHAISNCSRMPRCSKTAALPGPRAVGLFALAVTCTEGKRSCGSAPSKGAVHTMHCLQLSAGCSARHCCAL
uniref:Uncharacterized protein n=1 Tax=Pavo cristatus TaxID=9049 RepID=A0A8C9EWY0_PAVCR